METKGGEELTRRVCVERSAGEEGPRRQNSMYEAPHQEGAWHVPGTERSQEARAAGEGRASEEAGKSRPESSGLSVRLFPGSLFL